LKKEIYLKKVWPEVKNVLWKNLDIINLPPQIHVNAWRWHHSALPLKERVSCSSSIDSIFCRWCPTSPQTHQHFLQECSFTKMITQEIVRHLDGCVTNIE
ncbi:1132_t:CDS:1, partial [Ambispora gerdemannii]